MSGELARKGVHGATLSQKVPGKDVSESLPGGRACGPQPAGIRRGGDPSDGPIRVRKEELRLARS